MFSSIFGILNFLHLCRNIKLILISFPLNRCHISAFAETLHVQFIRKLLESHILHISH